MGGVGLVSSDNECVAVQLGSPVMVAGRPACGTIETSHNWHLARV